MPLKTGLIQNDLVSWIFYSHQYMVTNSYSSFLRRSAEWSLICVLHSPVSSSLMKVLIWQ